MKMWCGPRIELEGIGWGVMIFVGSCGSIMEKRKRLSCLLFGCLVDAVVNVMVGTEAAVQHGYLGHFVSNLRLYF